MSNRFLVKLSCGANLDQNDIDVLTWATRVSHVVPANRDLIVEGSPPENVHLIQSGFACRYKTLPDGTRAIVAYMIPGDICDLHVAVLGWMDHSIATLTRCEVVLIPRATIDDFMANYPNIRSALWWCTLVDEAILREWLVCMGRRPAVKQLAHLFCELWYRLRQIGLVEEKGFHLPITQDQLADTLGLSSIHVNRLLQDLRKDGLVVLTKRRLTVPDLDRLQVFAEFNAGYLHQGPGSRRTQSNRKPWKFRLAPETSAVPPVADT